MTAKIANNPREKMSISVVVCAYTEERWEELNLAVSSIRQQTQPPSEIILVIDHNPQLFDLARTKFQDLVVVSNLEMRGLSGARNTGMNVATGEIVAFMDEDAFAEPDWLKHLESGYLDSEVLGVGGVILPEWTANRPVWFPEEFDWVVGCTYRGMPTATAPVRNLIGANMSFRKSVFLKVGGFKNGLGRIGTLPMGCEETEYCIRAIGEFPNGIVLYEPQARVHHKVPTTRATWRYFLRRCYAEGLSKAQVSRAVGSQTGLSNERTYMLSVLPHGLLTGFRDSFREKNTHGLKRSFAISVGLLTTIAGYLYGSRQAKRFTAPRITPSVRKVVIGK